VTRERPFSALALDIDGTLITSEKVITPFTRNEIVRVVRDFDLQLFLVTARGPQSTAVIEERLGVPASHATYGGSVVLARHDERFETLIERPIADTSVAAILARAMGSGAHLGVYTRDTWYVSSLGYWGLREARNTAVWPVVKDDLAEGATVGPVFKIMFRGETDVLESLAAELDHLSDDVYVHYTGSTIEIVSAEAVKFPAVSALSEHFGFGVDRVIAFGDTEADVGMLDNVGVGVLMANAKSDVRVADHVERTLSHNEDGIGVMLRKYFPTELPFDP